MLSLTDATFAEAIAAPQAAVYFWSPACGYCRTFTPLFEGLESRYGGVLMAKANIQDAPQAAAAQGLEGVPTVIFFKNGQVVGKEVTGGMSEPEFVALMNAAFPEGAAAPVPAGVDAGAASHSDSDSLWPLVVAGLLGVGAAYYLLE